MFEWSSVTVDKFVNEKGVTTEVKLLYPFRSANTNYFVKSQGRELDAVAFDELGSEYEAMNVLQNNAVQIVEYNFNMSKVKNVFIP